MVEALAEALLYEGVRDSIIPRPAGVRTKELAERAEAAITEVVRSYHEHGGVVLAKDFAQPIAVVAEMAKQWITEFGSTPPGTDLSKLVSGEELSTRLGAAAQTLAMIVADVAGVLAEHDLTMRAADQPAALDLLGRLMSETPRGTLTIRHEQLEGLCQRAALAMFSAFQEPDRHTHRTNHGEEP
jgi:hypothetical protein